MSAPVTTRVTRIEVVTVVVLFSALGYVYAPFSLGDRQMLVPRVRELDAIQQTLLIADGVEKLLTAPRSYYDTAILYPDRNQLRTTEPFIGFVMLALPLRTVLHLNDVDVFEALRWLIVFASLAYLYLLLRTAGSGAAMSVAGAVLCLSPPGLANGIERLQIMGIPLILAVLYHGLMWWSSRRLGHGIGLFVAAALYPLCGMVNATVAAMAIPFILPLLLRMLADEQRQGRLFVCLLPLLLAAAFDAVVLGPWLLDRSDLAVYTDDRFLETKHWNAMRLPLRIDQIPGFVTGWVGLGVASAFAMASVLAVAARKAWTQEADPAVVTPGYLLAVCAAVVGLAAGWRTGRLVPWLQLAFQAVCYAALFLYWRRQTRCNLANDQSRTRGVILLLAGGLGAFLCLVSFGPVYSSNDNLFASHLLTVLLDLFPPLRSLRDFDRIWIPGLLFVSLYLAVRLGAAVRASAGLTHATAAVVVAAALPALFNRPLVLSASIEPPKELVESASWSRSVGALYVHPEMYWNSASGVWMIAAARQLRRPIVNGYLGIEPPWFVYASSVLHRFPDAEAVWLLRRWNVATAVSLAGDVRPDPSALIGKVFERGNWVVYGIAPPTGEFDHPSAGECLSTGRDVRIAGQLSGMKRVDGGSSSTITLPEGFLATAVEITFRQSIVERMPATIDVYAFEDSRAVRLNQDDSGAWIESLAAEALVRRQAPVATIRLVAHEGRGLEVRFRNSEAPPIDRVALCGRWQ